MSLVPGILEAIIILVTVYALGSELKYGTSKHLLEKTGGSMSAALLGKLIPYTVLFTAIGAVCNLVLYDWAGFPMAGSVWNMMLGTFLLVLACESVAIFIIGTLPVLRLAISISALYCVLGFSLAGFTFPVEAMPGAVQGVRRPVPAQTLLSAVRPGSDFRERIRWLVWSGRIPAPVHGTAAPRLPEAAEGVCPAELSEELKGMAKRNFK